MTNNNNSNNTAAANRIQGWWQRLSLRVAASNYVLHGAGHELLASGQMPLGQVLDTVVHDPLVVACTQRLVLALLVFEEENHTTDNNQQQQQLRRFVNEGAEALGLAHFFAYEPRCDHTTPMFDTTHHHALMAASRALVAALRSLALVGGGVQPAIDCLRRYMPAYRAWANPIVVVVDVGGGGGRKKEELRRALLGQYATLANLGLFVPDQIRPLRLRLQEELGDTAWLETLDLDRGLGQLERHLALANDDDASHFFGFADIHVLPMSVTKLTCEVLLNAGFTPRLLPAGGQRKQHIGYIAWDGEGVDLVPLVDCIERPNVFWRRMASSAEGRTAAVWELLNWIPKSLRLAGMPRDEALAELEAYLLRSTDRHDDEADTLEWCMRWVLGQMRLARPQQTRHTTIMCQQEETEPRDWAAGLAHLRTRCGGGGASGVAVAVILTLLRTVDTLRLRCLTRRVRAMACPAQVPFLWAFLGKQAEAELGMAAADGASALSHERAVRELTDAYNQMLAMPLPIAMNGSLERYVTEVALVDALLAREGPKEPSVLFYGFGHVVVRLRETLDRLTRVAVVMRAFKVMVTAHANNNNDASSRLCSDLWRVLLPTLQQPSSAQHDTTTTTTTTTTLAFGRACLTAVVPLTDDTTTMMWVRIERALRHHLVFGKDEEAHHQQVLRLMREAAATEETRELMEQHLASVIKATIGYGEQQLSAPLVVQFLTAPPAYRMLKPLGRDLTRLVWHLARLSRVYHDIHGTRNAGWLHQFVFGGRF